MSDIKRHEPLWDAWYVESLIGQGAFSKVYKIRKDAFGQAYYSALKVISIPQNDHDIQQMKREGLDDFATWRVLEDLARNVFSEIELMNRLRGNSHIVSFEDSLILENKESGGWDILIRMELLTSLADVAAGTFLPQDEVVKLGIHMCRALELCALNRIIHRDIKPDNIFLSPYGDYKLGDFGIARQIERTSSGLSKKGTNSYMAPEVFRYESYGAGADIYSLGVVLYSLLNQNRTPFLPEYPKLILIGDREQAMHKRMNGEAVPPLKGVGSELNGLILKACAYNRQDRFSGPTEMRELLENLEKSAKPRGTDMTEALFREKSARRRKPFLIGVVLASALVLALVIWGLFFLWPHTNSEGNTVTPEDQIDPPPPSESESDPLQSDIQVLLSDSFDAYPIGSPPPGWTTNTSGGPVTIEEAPGSGEKSLKITKPEANTGFSTAHKRLSDVQSSGVIIYEARVMTPDTQGKIFLMMWEKTQKEIPFKITLDDKRIMVNDTTFVQAFVPSKWIHIVAKLNIDTRKIDLTIDDVDKGTFNFYRNTDDVGAVIFSVHPGFMGTLYVNYFRVTREKG
ncbi:MAG: serine/threonine protein kinase [Peptococcaceae bacterium]|nr:serine/threonine protein kinase [Peptococcaceae bacterium]